MLRDVRAGVHASTTIDGTVVLDGVLDAVRGAIVTGELARLEHEVYLADKRAGVVRTASQRRADALVEMARRSTGATGTPARPLFTVLVGDESLTRLCELGNGTVIAPGALLPWMCTAMLESVIFDSTSSAPASNGTTATETAAPTTSTTRTTTRTTTQPDDVRQRRMARSPRCRVNCSRSSVPR